MAKGTLALSTVKLGDNADTSKNFLIKVPPVADGTLVIERENGTDVLSIDVNGKLTFTAADNQLPLGVNQTWQVVTGSRVIGTTYTNSTGRPIMVSVWMEATAANQTADLTIGGVGMATIGASGGASNGGYDQLTGIVPAGATYSVTGTSAYRGWTELR